jgi:hypothetical protein
MPKIPAKGRFAMCSVPLAPLISTYLRSIQKIRADSVWFTDEKLITGSSAVGRDRDSSRHADWSFLTRRIGNAALISRAIQFSQDFEYSLALRKAESYNCFSRIRINLLMSRAIGEAYGSATVP